MTTMKLATITITIILSLATVTGSFKVYWNVPTEECHKYDIYFNLLPYKIIQNYKDQFYGNRVRIFYNPGRFPYIINGTDSRNGGIPQNANLSAHVQAFVERIKTTMPEEFQGVAVLDFESYYPSYRMSSPIYQHASKEWAHKRHPTWPEDKILALAAESFNSSARPLFQLLLDVGRTLRPRAQWGYYHYPYCHNYGPDQALHCQDMVMEYNNETNWLFKSSSALFPSIYIFKDRGYDPLTRELDVVTKIMEAIRIRKLYNPDLPIYPYFWYRYHDYDQYLSSLDVVNTLGLSRMLGLEGNVIWGSHNDVGSKEKCLQLKNYVTASLGPLVKYITDLPLRKLNRLMKSRKKLEKLIFKIQWKTQRRIQLLDKKNKAIKKKFQRLSREKLVAQ